MAARHLAQVSNLPSTSRHAPICLTCSTDARFEVLGASSSLLSASISASQVLHTRKGTLVGFNGTPENAVSTLSILAPVRRALLGIPFLYQRVTSTTPFTALIATKSPITSLVVVHLDGRLDWMIAQRNALVAWTGHTLKLSPGLNAKMVSSLARIQLPHSHTNQPRGPSSLGLYNSHWPRPPRPLWPRSHPSNSPQDRRKLHRTSE